MESTINPASLDGRSAVQAAILQHSSCPFLQERVGLERMAKEKKKPPYSQNSPRVMWPGRTAGNPLKNMLAKKKADAEAVKFRLARSFSAPTTIFPRPSTVCIGDKGSVNAFNYDDKFYGRQHEVYNARAVGLPHREDKNSTKSPGNVGLQKKEFPPSRAAAGRGPWPRGDQPWDMTAIEMRTTLPARLRSGRTDDRPEVLLRAKRALSPPAEPWSASLSSWRPGSSDRTFTPNTTGWSWRDPSSPLVQWSDFAKTPGKADASMGSSRAPDSPTFKTAVDFNP
jgi:hypothetical protein